MIERPRKHRVPPEPRSSATSRLPPPPPPPPDGSRPSSSAAASGDSDSVGNGLFKDLVEIVPLVESLIDRRSNPSFRRRASMVYTPAPSQPRKVSDSNGRKTAQTISGKNQTDARESINLKDAADDFPIFMSKAAAGATKKHREESAVLREQVAELQKKLSEKDEALRSAENSINQVNEAQVSVDELRQQVVEKDSLVKSTYSQLYSTKIDLADKQAALEKLEWEVKMSNRKVEELQGKAVSMEFVVNALMQIFEELPKNDSAAYPDVNIDFLDTIEQLPDIDDTDVERMEEARIVYMAAIAAAKENPNEELIAAAAEARQRLQAFVL